MQLESVRILLIAAVGFVLVGIAGCADNVQLPSSEQLRLFREVGPSEPAVDVDQDMVSRLGMGPYRVVPDEVLEVSISSFLGGARTGQVAGRDTVVPIVCRVNEKGRIALPVIGEIPVAGLSLPKIEASVIRAYYPTYAEVYPSVFVKLLEPKRYRVSITGAVSTPGVYALRSDQMCLLSLLMEAGGIVEPGAASIRIDRSQALSKVLDRADLGPSTSSAGVTQPLSRGRPDWNLSFRQGPTRTTAGWLSAARGGETFLHQGLDVASEPDRWALVQRLTAFDSEVDSMTLERRLAGLAASLGASGQARLDCVSLCFAVEPHPLAPRTAGPLMSSHLAAAEVEETIGQDRDLASGPTTTVLPVKGIHAPFTNMALQEGDRVTVKRMVIPIFTVIGLVNRPGNFEYPPDAHYNLIQALGFAGGLDLRLDPRYAVVYRQNPNGQIVHAAFQLSDPKEQGTLARGAAVAIRPGDIVAIEPTPRTRTKEYIEKFVNVSVGAYVPLFD
jgi:protein involved in polysaccharide export with SLBB domain